MRLSTLTRQNHCQSIAKNQVGVLHNIVRQIWILYLEEWCCSAVAIQTTDSSLLLTAVEIWNRTAFCTFYRMLICWHTDLAIATCLNIPVALDWVSFASVIRSFACSGILVAPNSFNGGCMCSCAHAVSVSTDFVKYFFMWIYIYIYIYLFFIFYFFIALHRWWFRQIGCWIVLVRSWNVWHARCSVRYKGYFMSVRYGTTLESSCVVTLDA